MPQGGLLSPRIVVVDDDRDIRQMLVDVLLPDCRVGEAAGLREALDVAARLGGLDLLITDCHLAGEHGRGVVHGLQQIYGKFPVLYVTGAQLDESELAWGGLPHARVVRKPASLSAVRSAAEELLGLRVPRATTTLS